MKFQCALFLAVLSLPSTSALADKILAPGEIYTAAFAGEKIACSSDGSAPGDSFPFTAEGTAIMTSDEMRAESRCTGVMDSSSSAMLRAKEVAISNGSSIQCPRGYRCEPQPGGKMQYRPRGSYCTAFAPFRAVR